MLVPGRLSGYMCILQNAHDYRVTSDLIEVGVR